MAVTNIGSAINIYVYIHMCVCLELLCYPNVLFGFFHIVVPTYAQVKPTKKG